mgnify:CR=1 FL=1|tara:strand:- start:48 stop:497 length:450 start_codon:yes stop_codon:yes gene_type:complete
MKEGEEQDNPTLFEIMKDDPNITYNEAAKVQEELRLKKEAGVCITSGMKRDRDAMELKRMKKKVQEAEGELSIVKGVGMNSPEMKEAQHRIKELENSLSIALEINESHQRYNGKLQTRVTDLEDDNKKLTKQISDHIKKYEDVFRKAGM